MSRGGKLPTLPPDTTEEMRRLGCRYYGYKDKKPIGVCTLCNFDETTLVGMSAMRRHHQKFHPHVSGPLKRSRTSIVPILHPGRQQAPAQNRGSTPSDLVHVPRRRSVHNVPVPRQIPDIPSCSRDEVAGPLPVAAQPVSKQPPPAPRSLGISTALCQNVGASNSRFLEPHDEFTYDSDSSLGEPDETERQGSSRWYRRHKLEPITEGSSMTCLQYAYGLAEQRASGLNKTQMDTAAEWGGCVLKSVTRNNPSKLNAPCSNHLVESILGLKSADEFMFGFCPRCARRFPASDLPPADLSLEAASEWLERTCEDCGHCKYKVLPCNDVPDKRIA